MTQLLLFDTPAAESFAPRLASDAAPVAPRPAATPLRGYPEPVAEPLAGSSALEDYRPGLQRMGDLARLVLLRHDLIAQRRRCRSGSSPARRP